MSETGHQDTGNEAGCEDEAGAASAASGVTRHTGSSGAAGSRVRGLLSKDELYSITLELLDKKDSDSKRLYNLHRTYTVVRVGFQNNGAVLEEYGNCIFQCKFLQETYVLIRASFGTTRRPFPAIEQLSQLLHSEAAGILVPSSEEVDSEQKKQRKRMLDKNAALKNVFWSLLGSKYDISKAQIASQWTPTLFEKLAASFRKCRTHRPTFAVDTEFFLPAEEGTDDLSEGIEDSVPGLTRESTEKKRSETPPTDEEDSVNRPILRY